jgi:hypothetical protein
MKNPALIGGNYCQERDDFSLVRMFNRHRFGPDRLEHKNVNGGHSGPTDLLDGSIQLNASILAIPFISTCWQTSNLSLVLACRLLHDPPSRCKRTTERDKMEPETSSHYQQIQYEKETYHAAVCHRCGAKMFPVELLEAHMDRHELKDMYLQSELKKLQYSMNRMR